MNHDGKRRRTPIERDHQLDGEIFLGLLRLIASVFGIVTHALDRLFLTTLTFVAKWLNSRRWLDVGLGIPAVIIALVLLSVVIVGSRTPKQELAIDYRQLAAKAMASGNAQAGELWLQKSAWLDENQPDLLFKMALIAQANEDLQRARQLMQRIAPNNGRGYPEAHFWLANDLITQQLPVSNELVATLEHHLTQATRSERLSSRAHALFGQVSLARQDIETAITHFMAAAMTQPELNLTLAELYRMQDRTNAAMQAAGLAAEYFSQQAKAEPDEWRHRLQWMMALLKQQKHSEALRILSQLPASMASKPEVREAQLAVYLDALNQVMENDGADVLLQMQLLQRILQLAPGNPRALALLIDLAVGDSEATQQARKSLKHALALGAAPTLAHLILGMLALKEGNTEAASTHLELAHERDPESSLVLNHLAWALAHKRPAEPERALQLIETAMGVSERSEFHGTRAAILAQLGRPSEAVSELESVLPTHPAPTWIHQQLADLYTQLNNVELAAKHRALAGQSPTP